MIIQAMKSQGYSKVEGYNKFTYIRDQSEYIEIGRENGKDTKIYFDKMLRGIEEFQTNNDLYDEGPSKLRDFGITHVNSHVWSMLHLLDKEEYQK